MAATELLAAGNAAADSIDIVVLDGGSVTIGVKDFTAPCELRISIKVDATNYQGIAKVSSAMPVCIQAPGTYRVSRAAGVQCGAYSA